MGNRFSTLRHRVWSGPNLVATGGTRETQTLHLQLPRFEVLKCAHVAQLQPAHWPEPRGTSIKCQEAVQNHCTADTVGRNQDRGLVPLIPTFACEGPSLSKSCKCCSCCSYKHSVFNKTAVLRNNLAEFHSISENGRNTFALKILPQAQLDCFSVSRILRFLTNSCYG